MVTDAETPDAEELDQNRRPAVSGERPAKLFRYSGAQTEPLNVVARAKWTKGVANGGEFDENSDLHIRVGDENYQCHKYPLQRESEFFEGVAKWGKRASPGSGVKPVSGYSTNSCSKGNAVSSCTANVENTRNSSKSTTSSSPGGDTAQGSGAESKSNDITNSINNITNSINNITNSTNNFDLTNNFGNNSVHLSDLSDLLPAPCLEDATIFETVLDFVYSTEQNVFRIPANKAFYLFRISEKLGMKSLFERCAQALQLFASPHAPNLLRQAEACCLPPDHEHWITLRALCMPEVVEFFQAFTVEGRKSREDLLALSGNLQREILEDDELGVDCEDRVFDYVKDLEAARETARKNMKEENVMEGERNGGCINGGLAAMQFGDGFGNLNVSANQNTDGSGKQQLLFGAEDGMDTSSEPASMTMPKPEAKNSDVSESDKVGNFWQFVRWNHLSQKVLKNCMKPGAVPDEVFRRFVLPAFQKRFDDVSLVEAFWPEENQNDSETGGGENNNANNDQNDSDSENGAVTGHRRQTAPQENNLNKKPRESTERYRRPNWNQNPFISSADQHTFHFFVDLVVKSKTAENGESHAEFPWGAIRKSHEKANELGLSASDVSAVVDIPKKDDFVFSESLAKRMKQSNRHGENVTICRHDPVVSRSHSFQWSARLIHSVSALSGLFGGAYSSRMVDGVGPKICFSNSCPDLHQPHVGIKSLFRTFPAKSDPDRNPLGVEWTDQLHMKVTYTSPPFRRVHAKASSDFQSVDEDSNIWVSYNGMMEMNVKVVDETESTLQRRLSNTRSTIGELQTSKSELEASKSSLENDNARLENELDELKEKNEEWERWHSEDYPEEQNSTWEAGYQEGKGKGKGKGYSKGFGHGKGQRKKKKNGGVE